MSDGNERVLAPYSRVTRRMWNDAKFRRLSAAPPNGQTLWLRLLTAPELRAMPGLIPIGEAGLAEALGWTLEGFREAFGEAFREGMVEADWSARLVWLPSALKHNPPQSPNVVRSWKTCWAEFPDCDLKTKAHRQTKAFLEAMGEAFAEAFSKACPNQDQDQDQDQEIRNRNVPLGVLEPRIGIGRPTDAGSTPTPTATTRTRTATNPAQPPLPTIDVEHGATVAPEASPEESVYAHWVAGWKAHVGGVRTPLLDGARRRKISARLRDGYTVADLTRAIDGCWLSAWHMENKQWDVALICRDAAHVDRFIGFADSEAPAPADVPPPEVLPQGPFVPPPPELAAKLAALTAGRSAFLDRALAEADAATTLPHESLLDPDPTRTSSERRSARPVASSGDSVVTETVSKLGAG